MHDTTIATFSRQSEADARAADHQSTEDVSSQPSSSRGTAHVVDHTTDQAENVEDVESEDPGPVVEEVLASGPPQDDGSSVYPDENAAYLTSDVYEFNEQTSALEFPDVYDAELFGISPEASFGGWPTVSAEAASQWWFNLLASDINNSQSVVPNHIVPYQRYDTGPAACLEDVAAPSGTFTDGSGYVQTTLETTNNLVILTDTEIQLVHHYVVHLSGWIDATDPDRQFAVIVPDLALRNQGLASAILALSSLHLSLESKPQCSHSALRIDPTTSVQYYNETLGYLQREMGNAVFLRSDELLATVLIISMFEMVETQTLGSAWDKHLRGVFWIQRSQTIHGESQGLKKRIWCKPLSHAGRAGNTFRS